MIHVLALMMSLTSVPSIPAEVGTSAYLKTTSARAQLSAGTSLISWPAEITTEDAKGNRNAALTIPHSNTSSALSLIIEITDSTIA